MSKEGNNELDFCCCRFHKKCGMCCESIESYDKDSKVFERIKTTLIRRFVFSNKNNISTPEQIEELIFQQLKYHFKKIWNCVIDPTIEYAEKLPFIFDDEYDKFDDELFLTIKPKHKKIFSLIFYDAFQTINYRDMFFTENDIATIIADKWIRDLLHIPNTEIFYILIDNVLYEYHDGNLLISNISMHITLAPRTFITTHSLFEEFKQLSTVYIHKIVNEVNSNNSENETVQQKLKFTLSNSSNELRQFYDKICKTPHPDNKYISFFTRATSVLYSSGEKIITEYVKKEINKINCKYIEENIKKTRNRAKFCAKIIDFKNLIFLCASVFLYYLLNRGFNISFSS